MSITMDRYTYTPNLLLNKRLTPPLSPSGRNPSLHPRIISHISRHTKERGRGKRRKREQRGGGGVDGAKYVWGHSSVFVGDQRVMGSHAWQNRDQRIICNHVLSHTHTHTHAQTRVHTSARIYTCQQKGDPIEQSNKDLIYSVLIKTQNDKIFNH